MKPDAFCTREKIVVLRLNSLDYVPSGLYCAQLLGEKGLGVLAVEYGYFSRGWEEKSGPVPRLRLGHPWLRRFPGWIRAPLLNACVLIRLLALFATRGRPNLVVAQGLSEQFLAWLVCGALRVRYAVHVHEVYDAKDVRGWNRGLLWFEGRALSGAVFTIFPEVDRARVYQQRYALRGPQHIAFNCPRRLSQPLDRVEWRSRLGLAPDARLLGFWGGQGTCNALEHAIRAVARLPRLYFLLWGWSSQADRERFKNLAAGVGASHRILFLGELPERKWDAIGGLDLGYCLYEPKELRLKHLATASNKFMESLACGVPVITSSQPDFKAVVDFYDVGACARDFSVSAIVEALIFLLDDEPGLVRRKGNALRCHEQVFNYEYQSLPVMRAVERALGSLPRAEKNGPQVPIAAKDHP